MKNKYGVIVINKPKEVWRIPKKNITPEDKHRIKKLFLDDGSIVKWNTISLIMVRYFGFKRGRMVIAYTTGKKKVEEACRGCAGRVMVDNDPSFRWRTKKDCNICKGTGKTHYYK